MEAQTKEIVSSFIMDKGIRLIAILCTVANSFERFPPKRTKRHLQFTNNSYLHGGKVLILVLLHFLFIFPSPPLPFLFFTLFLTSSSSSSSTPTSQDHQVLNPRSLPAKVFLFISYHSLVERNTLLCSLHSAPPARYSSSTLSQAISTRANNNFRTTCTQQQ